MNQELNQDRNKPTVFVSAGHYPQKSGAINKKLRLKEHFEAQKIVSALCKNVAQQSAIDYVQVEPGPLQQKVPFINSASTKNSIAVEVHFNAFQPNKAQGIETLFYPGSNKGRFLAARLQTALLDLLPFPDRGPKERDDLYFLAATNIPAVIIEALFIDNDREAYYLLYPRAHYLIGKTIHCGIKQYFNHYKTADEPLS